jgi:signal transduction histidine kinase
LLEAVAQWTFRQVSELQHHQMLIVLNEICNQLAPLHGKAMSDLLVQSLRDDWLRPYIRYDCELVVLARTADGDQLVFGCSEVIAQIKPLEQKHWLFLSKQLNDNKVHTFTAKENIAFAAGFEFKLGYEAMAVPIAIPGDAGLCGHFFLFSHKKLKQYQANFVKEAVKELSAILYQEKQYHDWRADVGTYRHIILSATQGLASNAKIITKRVKRLVDAMVDDWPEANDIRRSAARIHSEVVKIRNWTHFQRILYATHITPDYKLNDLKVDIRDWTARFKEMAAYAKVDLVIADDGQLAMARYDSELIDVAFSNLLENAIKYSPSGKKIVVSYQYVGEYKVNLSVINVGPEIPDVISKNIFEYGNRGLEGVVNNEGDEKNASSNTATQLNNQRIIPGQGIGLYLARKMVESHFGGLLEFTSEPNPLSSDKNDAASHEFFIEFEHQLGKAERGRWQK